MDRYWSKVALVACIRILREPVLKLNRKAFVKPRINIDTGGAKSPSNTWKLFKPIDLRSIHKTSCPRIEQCWAFWASYFVTGHVNLITWFILDWIFFSRILSILKKMTWNQNQSSTRRIYFERKSKERKKVKRNYKTK